MCCPPSLRLRNAVVTGSEFGWIGVWARQLFVVRMRMSRFQELGVLGAPARLNVLSLSTVRMRALSVVGTLGFRRAGDELRSFPARRPLC